ncbi:recombinase family protein [Novosphingobium sp. MMS21-SN21R]|uniref:recombinase family protein n=1 Tax=Novosphingobium sp. MMS21-SN21R TaxID=2969298 RepID=UPI002887F4EF|nr:recombinase family protein [Novosphingobium sp. MMS21-SN21R]MDT0507008.1 recombinase family protein [Novosphingobium sp. MMS21-SN21R]
MAEKLLRCAVYTRKSTEDGLEQEFNSLDAQYEACAAYALSQRHEGWTLVPDRFDDGGYSGGNMQRPAMQRLLAAVAAGQVDIILVYKIDRLTRSLADFAKIVEVLDKAGASFVSITQSFNTTTSMGRLTLNMLLSFAQFEREVTGERIRDKIAASKRKGMWMGGPVPLGYLVDNRKLVVAEQEAELVRHIYTRYLDLRSVVELAEELNRQGHRTKVQQRASGPHRGGCEFRRGTLYHLLSNRIYRGQVVHKGEHFAGEHPAIVPQELWDRVQEKLRGNSSGTSRRLRSQQPSLLVGMVWDGKGRAMTPSHATKDGRRYRYYVTRPDQLDGSPAWRVSAHDLEKLVCERLPMLLTDRQALCDMAAGQTTDVVSHVLARADIMAATLRSAPARERALILAVIIQRIDLREDCIELTMDRVGLGAALGLELSQEHSPMVVLVTATKVRHGHQLRLVIPGPQSLTIAPTGRDEKLVTLLADAHQARKLILAHPGQSIAATASLHGRCRTRLGKLAGLACLAPDIVTAIVEGRQPATLTARTLQTIALPHAWDQQRALLGFA